MLPDAARERGLSNGRARRFVVGVVVCAPVLAGSTAHAQDAQSQDARRRAEVRRSLRQSAFFGAELDARHRAAVYAADADAPGGDQSALRAFAYGSGDVGPFGLYLGLGAIVRPSGLDRTVGDPFADPYDDFTLSRSLRLFSAHVEYTSSRERGAPAWTIRAGRLTDFDRGARLLLYDGVRLSLDSSSSKHYVYGGRRALMDGGLADDRTSFLSQFVAGAGTGVLISDVRVDVAYRLEAVHRVLTNVSYGTDLVVVDVGVEARIGGREAVEAYESVYARAPEQLGFALVVRHDGHATTPTRQLSIDWRALVQLGTDPVTFGRGGLGPDRTDVEAAMGLPTFGSPLDRLFLGPSTAHALGDVELRYWPTAWLAVAAGGYVRQPLSAADRTSLRPGIVEVYGGPEVRVGARHRVGLEARYAWESPGTSDRIFDDLGDGERNSGALRLYGDLPFPLSESWRLQLRPEAEAIVYGTEGPLSATTNQRAFFGGLSAVVSMYTDFYFALRYGAGSQPTFFSDGVPVVHDVEATVGGRY